MKNPALKREVSKDKMLKNKIQVNKMFADSYSDRYRLEINHDFGCYQLTKLNFWNSGNSSLGLKAEVSLPRM